MRDVARTAIAAMREPTEAMAQAADHVGFVAQCGEETGVIEKDTCVDIYQTMIDAALKSE